MLESQRISQEALKRPNYSKRGWIGVDLDGTLAKCETNTNPNHIGAPVLLMLKRVRYWIKTGRTVKIFTARAGDFHDEINIHQWCVRHELPVLEITNRKDHQMLALWDNLAVGVVKNIGISNLPAPVSLWQSFRLRLLLLLGSSAVMKVDHRHLQVQFHAALEASRGILECDG
jgi:hypothetical protein